MEQMKLGELITILKRHEQDKFVRYDFVHFTPDGIDSYRGYYEQLAIGYSQKEIKVAQLLDLLKQAVGRKFEGYKGGQYAMHENTPLWVSNRSEAGGTAIVGVRDDQWCITLITASID
ncbi:MAG: hypothetical protein WBV94_25140 [Blastocatellia bacterium]